MQGQDIHAAFHIGASAALPYKKLVAELMGAARLPAMTTFRDYVELGILMSHGAKFAELWRGVAGYIHRILAGEDPGVLPIQHPTAFDFVINLKTARALGITIPPEIMIQATEFIE